MEKVLISGAVLVTMDEERADYFNGDLLVEGGRITAISERPGGIERSRAGRVIDGEKMIIMPGLINTHGHAAMTLFRGYADDMPLKEWLEQKIWPAEAHLDGNDVYWGTMLAAAEMLKGGTTTFADMYFFMDRVAEAAVETQMRAVLARGLVDIDGSGAETLKEGLEFINNWHGAGHGRINATLGPHAPYTCSANFLKLVMEAAGKAGRTIQIHLAETAGEVDASVKEHGRTPVQFIHDLGLTACDLLAAHCVHLSDDDIAILAENNVGVAHNPGSNLKLGSGIAPVPALIEAGVKVGLGTDGAASNNNLDMFEEMRLAALLAKGTSREPTLIPAMTALRMATVNGAAVLGLTETGRLKEGYRADLIGINLDAPHMAPLHDPPAQLVYAASAADVKLVIVDGEILVEQGRLTLLDEEKIIAEASLRAERLTGRSEKAP